MIELRHQICDYYRILFDDNVCITAGAQEAIFASLFAYLNKGDDILIADPSFPAYATIGQMLQARTICFDLDRKKNFRFQPESFENALTSKTKIVLINNPINPTGTSYSIADLHFIIEKCRRHNILLIVDEVYRELYLADRPHSILELSEDAIVISSLSKSHSLSGWRLGWAAAARAELIRPVIKAHQYICTCASSISQHLALAAFSREGMKICEEIRIRLKENRRVVLDFFKINRIEYLTNTSSPYLFVSVPADDRQAAASLIDLGLIVIPGSAFGSNGKGYVRINYGVELFELNSGLEILKRYLQKI